MIEEDLFHVECPDFVLMNRDDVKLLVSIIYEAEYLEAQLKNFDHAPSVKAALDRWRKIYFSEV